MRIVWAAFVFAIGLMVAAPAQAQIIDKTNWEFTPSPQHNDTRLSGAAVEPSSEGFVYTQVAPTVMLQTFDTAGEHPAGHDPAHGRPRQGPGHRARPAEPDE